MKKTIKKPVKKTLDKRIIKMCEKLKKIRIEKGYTSYENFAWDNDVPRVQYSGGWRTVSTSEWNPCSEYWMCTRFRWSNFSKESSSLLFAEHLVDLFLVGSRALYSSSKKYMSSSASDSRKACMQVIVSFNRLL